MFEEFDYIVVGGGIAGASVAAELAEHKRVILLEREISPGYHATGRSAALYSEIYGNAAIRSLSRASRKFFLSADGETTPFATPRGFLHIATQDQLSDLETFSSLPDVAAVTDQLSRDAACNCVEVLRKSYIGGALLERSAFDLDVDQIHQFYLRRLKVNGGILRCSQALTSIEHRGGAWVVAATSGMLRAQTIINAAGAWGDEVARLSGVKPVGLEAKRRTALLVDAPPGVEIRHWPAVIDIAEQFYFKPDAGKILMSPADETPSDPCDAYPEELDVAVAVDRVQAAADIPVRSVFHSWAGLRTFAPDRSPVVGYDVEMPGFFWLVGQGGYGIQTAPALARLSCALAEGQDAPSDILDYGLKLDEITTNRLDRL